MPATVTPETIRTKVTVFSPDVLTAEPSVELIEEVATVSESVKEVVWMDPTDEDSSDTCIARKQGGEILAIAEKRDWQEALLAVIEELGPNAKE